MLNFFEVLPIVANRKRVELTFWESVKRTKRNGMCWEEEEEEVRNIDDTWHEEMQYATRSHTTLSRNINNVFT